MSETFTSVPQEEAGFRERTRLSFELDADICVIGAGLAGLSIALEAARLGASVAVSSTMGPGVKVEPSTLLN